jgi:protein-disulfide isomerase
MSSRQAAKEQAKAARIAREQSEAKRQRKRRQYTLLSGGVLVGVAIIVIALAVGGSSSSNSPSNKPLGNSGPKVANVTGIPQHNITLGNPNAPVTLVQFEDLECPICRLYMTDVFPTIVKNYVTTGKVKVQLRMQTFVGTPGDSMKAATFALAAAQQNKLWDFADNFYKHQKSETTPYATNSFITQVARQVPGLNISKAFAARGSKAVQKEVNTASQMFTANGFQGTPSFLVGRTGGKLSPINWTSFTLSQFTGPINQALNKR